MSKRSITVLMLTSLLAARVAVAQQHQLVPVGAPLFHRRRT